MREARGHEFESRAMHAYSVKITGLVTRDFQILFLTLCVRGPSRDFKYFFDVDVPL
jgi:hypothetical protein